MTLEGTEFIRRFLLHVLPKGFVRISQLRLSGQPLPQGKPRPLPPSSGPCSGGANEGLPPFHQPSALSGSATPALSHLPPRTPASTGNPATSSLQHHREKESCPTNTPCRFDVTIFPHSPPATDAPPACLPVRPGVAFQPPAWQSSPLTHPSKRSLPAKLIPGKPIPTSCSNAFASGH